MVLWLQLVIFVVDNVYICLLFSFSSLALFLTHHVWLKLQRFHSEVTHVGRMHFFLSLFPAVLLSITLCLHFFSSHVVTSCTQCISFCHFPRPCLCCCPLPFCFFFLKIIRWWSQQPESYSTSWQTVKAQILILSLKDCHPKHYNPDPSPEGDGVERHRWEKKCEAGIRRKWSWGRWIDMRRVDGEKEKKEYN